MPDKDKIISLLFEIILVFIIVFSPVFFGSYLPIPLAILESGCLLLLLVCLLKILSNPVHQVTYPAGMVFIVLFFCLLVFQLIPLPQPILNIISTHTDYLYHNYSSGFDSRNFYPVSLYPLNTREELVKLFCYFAVFLAVINCIEKRAQFKRIFLVIILLGLALAFYGIFKKYFILGKEVTYAFSTFGSKNHFSAYMIMVFSLTVGYSLYCFNTTKKILFGLFAAIIAATIFVSLSRAGAISIVFSLVLLAYFLKRNNLIKKEYATLMLVVIALLALVFLIGVGPVKERFGLLSKDLFSDRWHINRDSLAMFRDFPLFGVGLGNFHYCFTAYRNFVSALYTNQMHNDNLQVIMETGIFGGLLFFLFIFIILKKILTMAEERKDPFVKNMAIAGACGICGVLFHSFFDFNFHIPAVFFLFWLILGLLYKCVHTHFTYEDKDV